MNQVECTTLTLKPHHLLCLLQACPAYAKYFVPGFEPPTLPIGYDAQHTKALNKLYAHIAQLPPDTPIITDFIPDEFCHPCPKNTSGIHRDLNLPPCDPLSHTKVTDQIANQRLERIIADQGWDRFCDTLEKHHWRFTPAAQTELDSQPELKFTVANLLPGLRATIE